MTRDNNDARQEAPTRRGSALRAFYATKNPTKIKDSINDIRFFARFCGLETEEQVEEKFLGPGATQEQAQRIVTQYRDWLRSKSMAYGTINRRLAAIRTLLRLAKLTGVVSWEIDVSAGERTARRDTRGVSNKALKTASRMNDDTRQARRDKAIIVLARHARLTRAEILALLLEHYDPNPAAPSIMVAGDRTVLSKKVKKALDAWVEMRGFVSGALFTRHDDRSLPMSSDELIALVRPDSILS